MPGWVIILIAYIVGSIFPYTKILGAVEGRIHHGVCGPPRPVAVLDVLLPEDVGGRCRPGHGHGHRPGGGLMAGSPEERVIAAELLVVMGVTTADALSGASTGKFSLPDPSRYFATVIVFTMLAAAAMFGPKSGRLAAQFGGVASLAILIAPTKKTGKPLILSALTYFNQLMVGGVQSQPSTGSGAADGSTTIALPSGATITNAAGATPEGPTTVSGGPSAIGNPSGLA
jgi:hypothetical protein